jgi:hypothetical protein
MARYRVRNAREFEGLSADERAEWDRAGYALATARREGISLTAAARREGTTLEAILTYYGPAVTRRGGRGWYRPKAWDRAYRGEIHLTTDVGDVLLEVRDSRSRALASDHARAIAAYAHNDDPDGAGLRRFRGRRICGYRLLDDRDLDLVDRVIATGDLDWPDLYERVL